MPELKGAKQRRTDNDKQRKSFFQMIGATKNWLIISYSKTISSVFSWWCEEQRVFDLLVQKNCLCFDANQTQPGKASFKQNWTTTLFQKRVPWNAKIVFNEVVMGEDKWEEARAAAHRGAQGSLLPGSTLVFCAVNDWGGNLLKALHSSATRHDWVLQVESRNPQI